MAYRRLDSEDALENEAAALFAELGYEWANVFEEEFGSDGTLGRENRSEVVLISRLRPMLERLNPALPPEALDDAIAQLTRDRSAMTLARANQDVYRLLKDGVKVEFRDASGTPTVETVRVIDWNDPYNNDFFLAQQLWITGEMYTRRADLVGFVNGIPLVFVELKAHHKRIEDAFNKNLSDYRATIPQVFWYNGFVILSNGSLSRIGSTTAPWEHFVEWKKIDSEGEEGVVSLETMIRGTCEPARLLDIVENFTLFVEARGGLVKAVAKNHQYLGVDNALRAAQQIRDNQGRLGVFWHTQGSGKSFSMIFFAQKVFRKLPGNWTFVVVTDQINLDDQIYQTFANAGVVTEQGTQAESGEHLQRLLREDHRYIFTLIQKFHTEKGATYPVLSERSDIIVMTDEAHRSQYDILAMNMRNALPNAAFIGFTATPLIAGEEKTREVFGDYVSIYNFRQSVEDQATVPLFYENRIPELQLTNVDLNTEMERLLEDAQLDEAQERKLEREFAREYHLITRDDRLEKVAEDIVSHFMGRGYHGKAMVVSIDRLTAVRMYDKVQKYWAAYLDGLRAELAQATDDETRTSIEADIQYMEETDMAVIVSQSQGEIEEFREKGLDIETHRRRMVNEELDTKFKDPENPLRLAFVCAMWTVGFDVPVCSTIYLDKPMRNHTLMQTIARANRVFGEKNNGLIVDYVGIFRNLEEALAIYGAGSGGGVREGDSPIQDKSVLVRELEKALAEAAAFCTERGIDLDAIYDSEGFDRIALLDDAIEAILVNDETKEKYLALAKRVDRLFRAILPDPTANDYGPRRWLFVMIADKIRSLVPAVDISGVMSDVERLLDKSVEAEGYVITGPSVPVDLSQVDFDELEAQFASGRKRTEAERLRALILGKATQMARLNRTRMNFLEELQRLIEEYNSGSINVEIYFARLIELAQALDEEEKRGIAEQLTEEELALFDLLTRPGPDLTEQESEDIKRIARDLLDTLKTERLVLDWRKRQQSRAAVRHTIEIFLDQLPQAYAKELFKQKCDIVYQHVYDSYYGQGQSIYAIVA